MTTAPDYPVEQVIWVSLNPPHRAEPSRLAEMLIDFWTHGAPRPEA